MTSGIYPAIRSNSLPSISAKVVQRDLSRCRSRSLWAPRLSRRPVSASKDHLIWVEQLRSIWLERQSAKASDSDPWAESRPGGYSDEPPF